MNYVETKLQNIINENPLYENFINNYFKKNKLQFFEDRSLNYHNIPREYRTNNFLENYNGFIKAQLGKKRIINWVNFLSFLKNESKRFIDKLLLNANFNKAFIEKSKKRMKKNLLLLKKIK